MFYNIHTHHTPAAGQWAIVNVLQDFEVIADTVLYSVGLHPWYLNSQSADALMLQLNLALQKVNVLAVGECGLDKVCKTDYGLQQEYFRQQVLLANQHGKPLILHCVKAFDDTLRILKEAAVAVPVIFHGYHKSAELAAQLVKAGYYLSFGKHIMQAATATVFQAIPLNHIFLETDAAETGIEVLYAQAAAIKNISISQLEEQVAANAAKLFGNITLKI